MRNHVFLLALLSLATSRAHRFTGKVGENDEDIFMYDIEGSVGSYEMGADIVNINITVAAANMNGNSILDVGDFKMVYCDLYSDLKISSMRTEMMQTAKFIVSLIPTPRTISTVQREGQCLPCFAHVKEDIVSFCINSVDNVFVPKPVDLSIVKLLMNTPEHSPHIVWISITFVCVLLLVFVTLIVVVVVRDRKMQ